MSDGPYYDASGIVGHWTDIYWTCCASYGGQFNWRGCNAAMSHQGSQEQGGYDHGVQHIGYGQVGYDGFNSDQMYYGG